MTNVKPPKQLYKWHGAKLKLARPASNMLASLPTGTAGHVKKIGRGLEFTSDACECCGVQVRITRMGVKDFDLIALVTTNQGDGHENT
ncbi:TPA: hypothetical protein MNP25_003591 [Klebsiella pneumoniae]|uniref:hypothetical protein n=1 Tax=Klebsiella pneumoniae TaxID=573 RepID=UPI0007CBE331|nr:hypothetical protein [Klebsiella pneumoniae]EKW9769563.1 hypothetical protein [Klebsiella pneumoniae]EKZ5977229.1 hypothetical protein [Klebsiella pneumoniae]MBD7803871.1 hypothetical protein [Klebsiella pneumoniae]QLU40514.1 hypothetical protein HV227_13265 [Klebsiella pneumoniae]TXX12249.1 hypothetical protein D4M54_19580 [Klebsiella pneumoniae]